MNNLTKENFLQIASVFNSTDQQQRNKAYQEIENLLTNNPSLFVELCVSNLSDENVNEGVMRIVLTLLTKVLKNNYDQNYQRQIWPLLNKKLKEDLLACSFGVVLHPNANIKKQGADLISTIFCQDRLGDQLWQNIIHSISNNVSHEEKGVREAAVYSLSYICEYTQENKNIILTEQEIEFLLSGIFNNLVTLNELTLASIDALNFAIDFVIERMQQNNSFDTADYVFNVMIELLIKCKQNNSEESAKIICKCISCLKEICVGYYTKLEQYKDVIFEKVLQSLSVNTDVIKNVFYFFQDIFEIEIVEQTKYTDKIYKDVQSAVIEFLLSCNQQLLEYDGEASLIKSAYLLLKLINQIYGEIIFQNNISFIYENIEIKKINNTCAALVLFRSLIEHTDNKLIEEPLYKGFNSFVKLLDSNNSVIITQTLFLFQEVAKYFVEVFYQQENNQKIIFIIKKILSDNENFTPIEQQITFQILIYLTENVAHKTSNMTKYFKLEIQSLLDFISQLVFMTDNFVVLDNCFTFFFTVISNVAQPSDLLNYFDNFLNILESTLQKQQSDINLKIVQYIEIILNAIITRIMLQNNSQQIFQKEQQLMNLYETCKKQINIYDELQEEPFELMCTILLTNPQNNSFKVEVKNFVRIFVTRALQAKDQLDIFIKGVSFYLAIVNEYKHEYAQQLNEITLQLLDLIHKQQQQPESGKFLALQNCLNDCLMNFPDLIDQNFELLVQHEKSLMKQLILKKLKQFKVKDFDTVTKTAISICEMQINIMHHIGPKVHNYKYIEIYQELIVIFAEFTIEYMSVIKNPGKELAQQVLGIIADYTISQQNSNVFNQELIKFLILYLKKFQQDQEIASVFEYCENVFNIKIDDIK